MAVRHQFEINDRVQLREDGDITGYADCLVSAYENKGFLTIISKGTYKSEPSYGFYEDETDTSAHWLDVEKNFERIGRRREWVEEWQ